MFTLILELIAFSAMSLEVSESDDFLYYDM